MPFAVVSGVGQGMAVLDGGPYALREGEVLEFFHCHWFDWHIFKNRNVFNSDNTSLEMSIHWPSKEIVRFEIEVGVCEKYAKM